MKTIIPPSQAHPGPTHWPSQHELAAHTTGKQGNHDGSGARPIPARVGGEVVGERVEEGLGTMGKRFGAHRVKKLTGVWSPTAARSGNGEPPVVALLGGEGGRLTSQEGTWGRCRSCSGDGEVGGGQGGRLSEKSLRQRNGAAQWLRAVFGEVA
jgi:hypothetical protein